MELEKMNVRLVKLPADIELTLFMIREELKSTTLFNGLARVGLEDCHLQSHFGTPILAYIGFDDITDDLIEFYANLIDKYSEQMEADEDVMKCAFDVYVEMMIEKKKRVMRT